MQAFYTSHFTGNTAPPRHLKEADASVQVITPNEMAALMDET